MMPVPRDSGHCKTCGAHIRWARTTSGKLMPLDYEPDRNGVFVLHNVDQWHPTRAVAATHDDDHLPHYTSHFATCPQAGAHRRD